jgi:hypothetical protein
MLAWVELRTGLLRKADWGREDNRQTGLPELRYAVSRRQRIVSGVRAAGRFAIGPRTLAITRGWFY